MLAASARLCQGDAVEQAATPDPSRSSVIIGSSLALLIGMSITVLLHESSHAVAAALLGYVPTQLPFAVDTTPDLRPGDEAVAAITGPIFSLLSGLVAYAIDVARRPFVTRPFWRLVWLWTVFLSIQLGVSYFVVVAVLPAGDTAAAFGIWGVPGWGYAVATVLGVGAFFGNGWLFSRPLIAMTTSMKEKYAVAFWPWIAGTIGFGMLTTTYLLLTPDVPTSAVVAVVASVPGCAVFAPIAFMFGTERYGGARRLVLPQRPVAGLVLLGVIVGLNLILTRGWVWG